MVHLLKWLPSHPRFEMRRLLTVWNVFLACFSIMGACRTLPEFLHVLTTQGIYHSVCVPRYSVNGTSITALCF